MNQPLLESIEEAIAECEAASPVARTLIAARQELVRLYAELAACQAARKVAERRPRYSAAERRTIAEALRRADGHVVALLDPGDFAALQRRVAEGAKS
jgi:hypothetical protein